MPGKGFFSDSPLLVHLHISPLGANQKPEQRPQVTIPPITCRHWKDGAPPIWSWGCQDTQRHTELDVVVPNERDVQIKPKHLVKVFFCNRFIESLSFDIQYLNQYSS